MNKNSTGVLSKIETPQDLRRLSLNELIEAAGEIREMIIRTVSETGGHLASSLGTVELTLALHYVFNTPVDRLIWDVGHQAYAHKIVTGRKDRFSTLRQEGGLSAFPRREESPYDVLTVGHSGTSISAAAGIAEGRCLGKEDFKVLAVIGDGSISAGMAFEGLNWCGDQKKNLIIILNDNELSISPNVGALSSYLNRIMTGHTVRRLKTDLKGLIKSIPGIGEQMVKLSRQLEESVKSLFVPGALFEDLGFTYVGPLEGHRLDHLIGNLKNVRDLKGPVLVHVITRKGKGYLPAETDPLKYHGISKFDIASGQPAKPEVEIPTYTNIFGATMVRLAQDNKRIVAITAAMREGVGLTEFARLYPERFYDVGIAEQHAVTFAAGLAIESFLPVVAIYSTFLQRAYDQIIHDVCLQNLPVVFALDRSGIVGEDGPTHHGLFDLSYLRSIPNLVVMAPKDENEIQHMLKTAVECGRPAAVRYPRGQGAGVRLDNQPRLLPLGKGEIIRKGSDLAVLAIGSCVYPAEMAALLLAKEGISITVINARFVKPLDEDLIVTTCKNIKYLLTVEDNVLNGGFGSAVLELLASRGIWGLKVKMLGIPDRFVEHGALKDLRGKYRLDRRGIEEAIRSLLNDKTGDERG